MQITEHYRELNTRCHEENEGWGRGGLKYLDWIRANVPLDRWILDYGCGKGELVYELRKDGYAASGYDPAVPKWRNPPDVHVDFVVCTDVLEHVEPECLEDVIQEIADWAPEAFFSIGLVPAVKTLPDGSNAHRIVESADYWMRVLRNYYPVVAMVRKSVTTADFAVTRF